MYIAAAFRDGRLAIGITKYDTNYTPKMLSICGDDEMSSDDAKQDTVRSIKEATGVDVSADTVIPLCGTWALVGSKLASCLIYDPKNQMNDITKDAATVLENHPDFSMPCGEGQRRIDAIKDLDKKKMVSHIEQLTGIRDLQERYFKIKDKHQ